jgi:gliding motility-associated lipoprotein GldD
MKATEHHLKQVFLWLLLGTIAYTSCGEPHYTPKPRGYFRIDFPEKSYQTYSEDCPFSFDYPTYATIQPYTKSEQQCWFNIDFPKQRARLHFSYFPIQNNLNQHLENSRTLAYKHTVKATEIEETLHLDSINKVYAHRYTISGNTASASQFFVTDSSTHFLRGALYFSSHPNADSLAPAIDFIQEDITRLIQSFRWK